VKAEWFVMAAVAAAVTAACAADVQPVRTHVVEIRQFAFLPETISALPGDTIRWINRDPVPHTATSSNGGWDSGRLEAEGEWAMVVERDAAGDYVCAYHPNMRATVQVGRRFRSGRGDAKRTPRPFAAIAAFHDGHADDV